MVKIDWKKVGFVIPVCVLAWAFSEESGGIKGPDTNTAGVGIHRINKKSADSLKALEVCIRSEFIPSSRVFQIESQDFSDSLRLRCDELTLSKAISDSSILKEVKSKEEFNQYWKTVEAENGITGLKNQLNAEDVDKTLVPKIYALDSSVVIYPPAWIVIRKK